MIAAGAIARVAGSGGTRDVAVEEIATGPGQTSLAKDEIVVSILLPARPPGSSDAYLRFIPRTEMDIAVVGAGVSLTLDAGGVCSAARIALGAVAERALLVPEAAEALIGGKLDAAALARIHAPVGLAIGSKSPPGIAVSILAEIIQVWHRAIGP